MNNFEGNIESAKEMMIKEIEGRLMEFYEMGVIDSLKSLEEALLSYPEQDENVLFALDFIREVKRKTDQHIDEVNHESNHM